MLKILIFSIYKDYNGDVDVEKTKKLIKVLNSMYNASGAVIDNTRMYPYFFAFSLENRDGVFYIESNLEDFKNAVYKNNRYFGFLNNQSINVIISKIVNINMNLNYNFLNEMKSC